MRHLKAGRKLNRTSSHRKALFRNLAAALFHHESIKTTNPKALELRRVAERLISLAKSNSAHAVRLAFAYLARQGSGEEAFFRHRREIHRRSTAGTRGSSSSGRRKGDAAPMAIIELTQKKERPEQEKEKEQKREAKAKATKAAKKGKAEQADRKKQEKSYKRA